MDGSHCDGSTLVTPRPRDNSSAMNHASALSISSSSSSTSSSASSPAVFTSGGGDAAFRSPFPLDAHTVFRGILVLVFDIIIVFVIIIRSVGSDAGFVANRRRIRAHHATLH
jgi:hypothetical protein